MEYAAAYGLDTLTDAIITLFQDSPLVLDDYPRACMILKFRVLEADVMNSGPHGFRGKTIRLFREFVPQHWDRSEGSNYILLLKELAYQVMLSHLRQRDEKPSDVTAFFKAVEHVLYGQAEEVDEDDTSSSQIRYDIISSQRDVDDDSLEISELPKREIKLMRQEMRELSKALKSDIELVKNKTREAVEEVLEAHSLEHFQSRLRYYLHPIRRAMGFTFLETVEQDINDGRYQRRDTEPPPQDEIKEGHRLSPREIRDLFNGWVDPHTDSDFLALYHQKHNEVQEFVQRAKTTQKSTAAKSTSKKSAPSSTGGSQSSQGAKATGPNNNIPNPASKPATATATKEKGAKIVPAKTNEFMPPGYSDEEVEEAPVEDWKQKRAAEVLNKLHKTTKQLHDSMPDPLDEINRSEGLSSRVRPLPKDTSAGTTKSKPSNTNVPKPRMADRQEKAQTVEWNSSEEQEQPRVQEDEESETFEAKAKHIKSFKPKPIGIVPTKRPRRTKNFFTDLEVSELTRLVGIYGVGRWREILDAGSFQAGRRPIDLKDKWRNLQRQEERAALTLGVDTTPKVPRKRKRSVLEQQDNSANSRLFSDDDVEDSAQDEDLVRKKKHKVSED